MKSMFLVRSEHLNHQGHLFGGDLMAEIDTLGYCLVREEFGEKSLVTRAAEIEFEAPGRLGDVIEFDAQIARVGMTSVQVVVTGTINRKRMATSRLTYVNVGPDGKKQPIGELKPPKYIA